MWQISGVLGAALIMGGVSFKVYYDRAEAEKASLRTELQVAINNQAVLEGTISSQNEEILERIEKEKQNFQRINELSDAARAAETQVTDMRKTFAKHNLNMLSIRKPGLIQKVINKGTSKVNEELAAITNPDQFN
tara:strand:+ start:1181 stop:1585 length:405 start_codon:yes stop_codon:yes gene_type:complete